MTASGIPVDVEVLRDEIRKTYTDVSTDRDAEFIFPTGRSWAEELGHPQPELARVPDASVESFAGVADHWALGRVKAAQTAAWRSRLRRRRAQIRAPLHSRGCQMVQQRVALRPSS